MFLTPTCLTGRLWVWLILVCNYLFASFLIMKLKHEQKNIWGIKIKTSIITLEMKQQESSLLLENTHCLKRHSWGHSPLSSQWGGIKNAFFSRLPVQGTRPNKGISYDY